MLPIIGDIIKGVGDTISHFFPNQVEKDKAMAVLTEAQGELQRAVLEAQTKALEIQQQEFESKIRAMEVQTEVIKAEIKSDSWLTKNWRPLLMVAFIFILVFNLIVYPFLKIFHPEIPQLEMPVEGWEILKLGLGGYASLKTVENYGVPLITKMVDKIGKK